MSVQTEITLPRLHYRIIETLAEKGPLTIADLAKILNVKEQNLMRPIEELRAMKLIVTERRPISEYTLTNEGLKYLMEGLPEERVLDLVLSENITSLKQLSEKVESEYRNIALTHLLRHKVVVIKGDKIIVQREKLEEFRQSRKKLREALGKVYSGEVTIPDEVLAELKRRKLVQVRRRMIILIKLSPDGVKAVREGRVKCVEFVTKLTRKMLLTGKWKSVVFKPFNVEVEVPVTYPGRKHPYLEFLDQVREILLSMGFEEVLGPHIELEFWNFDVLFQAQDHPAREIHDTFFLKQPKYGVVREKDLFTKVRMVHENGWITGSRGWRYKWNPLRALRLILRTQTTSVSVRVLYRVKDRIYKAFSLDRVFRPEKLDPTHSMEFHQCEGIVVGPNVNFKHLLGFLKEFSKRLGLEKVMFKPAYFPFTEPSVEGYVYHKRLGWIEVLPGGMFRPEVLRPLGVSYNVLAWGIGIGRLAMIILDLDDIRDLFTQDLDKLRKIKTPLIPGLVSRG